MIKKLLLVVSMALVSASAAALGVLDPSKLQLGSANVLVIDAEGGETIYSKSADKVTSIASLTKLMTAMVVLDAGQPMDEILEVDIADFDFIKGSGSRLGLGSQLSRREMLRLALMSSENRAASAVARYYPGGNAAFVAAMNGKARELGMTRSRFTDSTGLSPDNVSTANDLAKMVRAAAQYGVIREFSTTPSTFVEVDVGGRVLGFNNSNRLVASQSWQILLQKTGYIREAGRCLVMLATIASKPVVIVLLDSIGTYTRLGDAERVKHWLETGNAMPVAKAKGANPSKARKATTTRVRGTLPARTPAQVRRR